MAMKEIDHLAILLVGEDGVGKTAIAVRFTMDQYMAPYDPTIEDLYSKQCVVDEVLAMIQLLDPAWQEDYRARDCWDSRMEKKEGVVLVYSIASRTTFEQIKELHQEILRIKKQKAFPMVLLGNQCDAEHHRQVSLAEGEQLAKEIGCHFSEASAKTGMNIDEAFYKLVREIRKYRRGRSAVPIDGSQNDVQRTDGCCGACVVL